MIDMDKIEEFKALPAKQAKVELQKYALEALSLKVTKSKTSVAKMVEAILDEADKQANGVEVLVSTKPPEVDVNVQSTTEIIEIDTPFDEEKLDEALKVIRDETPDDAPVGTSQAKEIAALMDADFVAEMNAIAEPINSEQLTIKTPADVVIKPVTQSKSAKIIVDVDKFRPVVQLTGAPNVAYMNLSYWLYQWIENTPDWINRIVEYPNVGDRKMLKTVAYYVLLKGSVRIRESRNSAYFIVRA